MATTKTTGTKGKEIGTKAAAELLGLGCNFIRELCALGEKNGGLAAWKDDGGVGAWRISLQSVLDYPERRIKARRE